MANKHSPRDHLAVGVQLPNGEIQKPMSGSHLYWTKPGKMPRFLISKFKFVTLKYIRKLYY